MSEERLNYIGNKPDYKYFQNEFTKKRFSEEEYNLIANENWNCKEELMKYLRADVKGLLEVMMLIGFSSKLF